MFLIIVLLINTLINFQTTVSLPQRPPYAVSVTSLPSPYNGQTIDMTPCFGVRCPRGEFCFPFNVQCFQTSFTAILGPHKVPCHQYRCLKIEDYNPDFFEQAKKMMEKRKGGFTVTTPASVQISTVSNSSSLSVVSTISTTTSTELFSENPVTDLLAVE